MNVSRLLTVPRGSGVAQTTAFEIDINNTGSMPRLGLDYTEQEYLVAGRAATFAGPVVGPLVRSDDATGYVTRILVRRPKNMARFSGRVLIEPFNTSSGPDTDVLWSHVGSLLERNGDAWVGVTNRASSQRYLVSYDDARYGDIDISSNDIGWELLAQAGALIRDASAGPLEGLTVRHVYLGGYSQSGCDTATFAMALHRYARQPDGAPIFDGYFPAAHSASVTNVASGTVLLPAFEYVPMGQMEVPVVDVETQTDVEGFHTRLSSGRAYVAPGSAHVRRPDSDQPGDRYRLYEVAGAPHAGKGTDCEGGGSTFPTSAFLRAGLATLFRWVEMGITPPRASPMELATLDQVSEVRLDEYGNAIGGVRSPFVDAPLARYEAHSGPGPRCLLVGRETPLSHGILVSRYGDKKSYLEEFLSSLDAAIAAGFLLLEDRAMLASGAADKAELAFVPVDD